MAARTAMVDSPASPVCSLVLITVAPPSPTRLGRRLPVGEMERLGSSDDDDVSIAGEGVVPGHALIQRAGGRFFIAPSEGDVSLWRAGSRLAATIDAPLELVTGDHILVGRATLEVLVAPSERELQAAYVDCVYRLVILDGLTGAYTATFLRELIEREARRAAREPVRLSLLVVGIDDLGQLAAAQGSEGGDHLLREVAHRIMQAASDEETVARLDGEELALLVPGPLDVAEERGRVIDRLVRERRVDLANVAVAVTATMGAASFQGAGDTAELLIERARAQLRAVRAQGGTRK
jgi:diguanylate cyclase (GGDEF)-like protein